MNYSTQQLPFFDSINATLGLIVSILTYVFGEHWILFAGYLALNIVDYVTGCLKSRINNKTNSQKGAVGVLKKFGYWMMIMVAFGSSAIFIEIGDVINVNLGVTKLLGWFVLATLIINEIRSIIENFIEAGYDVPEILTKGLEVAHKALDNIEEEDNTNDE